MHTNKLFWFILEKQATYYNGKGIVLSIDSYVPIRGRISLLPLIRRKKRETHETKLLFFIVTYLFSPTDISSSSPFLSYDTRKEKHTKQSSQEKKNAP